MGSYFLEDGHFAPFVSAMLKATRVIGPVAKKKKFVFQELTHADELRLDYDVTILPAKKAFFPQWQELVRFAGDRMESHLRPVEQVLFGVHFYEIKAIDMLDEIFRQGHEDRNYLANRESTTIVGSSIQSVSPRAFWASVGTHVKPKGHDAFLTKVKGGYVYETLTAKGEKLVQLGKFAAASQAQIGEARRVNEDVWQDCPERLPVDSKTVAERVRAAFKKEDLWRVLASDCFSCGTCNTVCPTCYCFDVQDTWNLDQVSGTRGRTWDGCLLDDFAKVSLGQGATENFREDRHQRFRHRLMRKMTYLNEKLGGPACVGCGRCSVGCVPDIADPVSIVTKIMEA